MGMGLYLEGEYITKSNIESGLGRGRGLCRHRGTLSRGGAVSGVEHRTPDNSLPGSCAGNPGGSLGGWALGLGIAGLVCCGALTGVPAIILGYLGIQAANQGRATNKGMSIAGVVLGAISVVLFIIAVATGALSDILDNLNS